MGSDPSSAFWEVRSVTTAAAAACAGVALAIFEFHDVTNSRTKLYAFVGGGVGVGIKASAGGTSRTRISVAKPFGLGDLNWAGGRITTAGAGLAVGGSLLYISAWTGSGTLFTSQPLHGFEWGSGAAAMFAHGIWKMV